MNIFTTTYSDIKRLPSNVINQIKAGEVVERPFNVVKELIENSLDAQCTTLKIELVDGGKRLIQVIDNGIGITKEQVLLAFERHTTSKLNTFDDLESLQSFGFRGEALASISSVSNVTIKTRAVNSEIGCQYNFESGKYHSSEDIMMNQGTSIAVKDIFQNVPPRLKFLRSTATEFSLIQDFLKAVCLSHPKISVTLIHNGRTLIQYQSKATLHERFIDIMGLDSENFAEINFEHGSFKLSGFAILPDKIHSQQNSIISFVNQRFVKDKLIRAGVYSAYQGLLMKGVVPSCILFVQIDPKLIDVNAHPSKTEIRFIDPIMVQDLISRGIQNSLKENITNKLVSISQTIQNKPVINHAKVDHTPSRKTDYNTERYPNLSRLSYQKPAIEYKKNIETEEIIEANTKISIPQNVNIKETLFVPIEKKGLFANAKFLGQYEKCFLLIENLGELWIIDQHAFHERILFEEILKDHQTNQIKKQMLLNPTFITIDPLKAHVFQESIEIINELGFDIEILKDKKIAIHAFPGFLNIKYLEQTFLELSEKILNEKKVDVNLYHDCFATMACHSAVRSGDPLNTEFVIKLLNRSEDVDFFAHCPHGRPVARKFSKNDVERWFERI